MKNMNKYIYIYILCTSTFHCTAPPQTFPISMISNLNTSFQKALSTQTVPSCPQGGAVLLLTGPSGCGKSATVQVLAQELGYRVQEWSNPSSLSEYRPSADRSDPDTYRQIFDPGEKNLVCIQWCKTF